MFKFLTLSWNMNRKINIAFWVVCSYKEIWFVFGGKSLSQKKAGMKVKVQVKCSKDASLHHISPFLANWEDRETIPKKKDGQGISIGLTKNY